MKATELIKTLNKLIEKHGDAIVMIPNIDGEDNGQDEIEAFSVCICLNDDKKAGRSSKQTRRGYEDFGVLCSLS